MPQVFLGAQSGCLLPFLIVMNFIFGRPFFNSASLWLGVEAVLILLLFIQLYVSALKIRRHIFNFQAKDSYVSRNKGHDSVVDVEGRVVEDDKALPDG